jgi:hypothetical protein
VAAPIEVAGLATPVPPEILAVVPAPDDPSLTHVVESVKSVALPAAAVVRMYSPVYGAVELVNLNISTGVDVNA